MDIGLVLNYSTKDSFDADVKWSVENGIQSCQLAVETNMYSEETASDIKSVLAKYSFKITALVGTFSGPSVYDFVQGPCTLGLIPPAYRFVRTNELIDCASFAQKLSVNDVCTHMGFIPEISSDPLYLELVSIIKYLAGIYKSKNINLLFETGQETPITLLRTITDINCDNVFINFDPANFLLYGKANSLDALKILIKHVKGFHAKDGRYPTDGINLGTELPLGKGDINISALIEELKRFGFDGTLTIEREINGEQQKVDISDAVKLLKSFL